MDEGLAIFSFHNSERPKFHVLLHNRVIKRSSNEALRVIHGVCGVSCSLALGSVTNQSLIFGKRDIRGRRPVTLRIRKDLDTAVAPDPHTRICGTQVNTNRHFLLGLTPHWLKHCMYLS
mmetsp:Transcript_86601/g.232207  ORF Transcript_86601/g.232207 Transcript_86601/m.232207 type:complete len:119 (+) Transcript_86601:1686-2042(+)